MSRAALAAATPALLETWFGSTPGAFRMQWFQTAPTFDEALRTEFGQLVEVLLADPPVEPAPPSSDETLAAILALDQLPRNLYRGTGKAHAGDAAALTLARSALASGAVAALPHETQRLFALMPFQHAEDAAAQAAFSSAAAALMPRLWEAPGSSLRSSSDGHAATIAKFGRFPHRNALLGRTSTPAELAYLVGERAGWEKA